VVGGLCHLTLWVSVLTHAGVIDYVTKYAQPHSHGVCILGGDAAVIIVALEQPDRILSWTARIWDCASH
jgi:hypothetical protein